MSRVLPFPGAAARLEPPAPSTPAAPDSNRPAPYAVRRYAAIPGQTLLVGHDGAGAPLMEVRAPSTVNEAELAEWIRDWCREHGASPLEMVQP